MRTWHGALLLVVAMVLLSTGICTGLVEFPLENAPAPGPHLEEFLLENAPAPCPNLQEFPPEYSCSKILYPNGCNAKTCHNKCFSQLKGDGLCINKGCQCSYLCKPPPVDI